MASDEFLTYVPADYETNFTIGGVTVQGIVSISEEGGGKTAKYIAEQYRQQKLRGDLPANPGSETIDGSTDGANGGADTPQGSDDNTGSTREELEAELEGVNVSIRGLEAKQADGTITAEEEEELQRLYQRREDIQAELDALDGGTAQTFSPQAHEPGHTGTESPERAELEAELTELRSKIAALEKKQSEGSLTEAETTELGELRTRRRAVIDEMETLAGEGGDGTETPATDGDSPAAGGAGSILGSNETGPDPEIAASMEQPALSMSVEAVCTTATYAELDALREETEPFDVALGAFTMEDMGIVDLSNSRTGQKPAYRVQIKLQEHRTVYIQEPSTASETPQNQPGSEGPGFQGGEFTGDPGLPTPATTKTVNLGDEGLQEGDAIDPYLREHLKPGAKVIVPAGTYEWNGYSPGVLTSAILEGEDGATIHRAAGTSNTFNIRASRSGDNAVIVRNLNFTGAGGGEGPYLNASAAPNGHLGLVSLRLPDGGNAGTNATGIRVPDNSGGKVTVFENTVTGFPNQGLVSTGSGPVRVLGGTYEDNGVANIHLPANGSVVKQAAVNTSPDAPLPRPDAAQRGIWITYMNIDDIGMTVDAGSGVVLASGAGTMNRPEIENNVGRPPIRSTSSGQWTVRDPIISGSGNQKPEGVKVENTVGIPGGGGGEGPVIGGGGSGHGHRTNLTKPSFTHRNAVYRNGASITTAVTDPGGTGLIENVYMQANQSGANGGFGGNPAIYVNQGRHRGILYIRHVHIFGYEDNAIYAENSPKKSGNNGAGRIVIENCYIHDCSGGSIRVPGNTTVRNCHLHNTNNGPPGRGSQGFVSYYNHIRGEVVVENTHCNIVPGNTRGSATAIALTASNPPRWTFRDCQIRGSVNDRRNRATLINCGSNPQINPQALGVPMTPGEASGG